MILLTPEGSGTVTILEAYRALLAANFTPIHDVEFHWYSAVSPFPGRHCCVLFRVAPDNGNLPPCWYLYIRQEEGGLLGSQAVATEYASRSAKIKAQLQVRYAAAGSQLLIFW